MKKIIKIDNANIIVIDSYGKRTPQQFLKARPNQGFFLVDLPYSKHNFYKKVNDKIVADEEKNLQKDLELQKTFLKKRVEEKLESKAKELGFDSFHNIGAYLSSEDNPLKASAEALSVYGGKVWGAVMQIEQQVASGDIEPPKTWEELEALLPSWE